MRSKMYTKETYYNNLMELLPQSHFTLDVYNGTEEPAQITCQTCGAIHTFSTAAHIARRARRGNKNVCKNCEKNKWTAAQERARHKAQYLLEKKQTIVLVGPIKSWASRELVLWKCLKCNHTFQRSPQVMFTLNCLNCPWCETHPNQYSEEMILDKVKELWGDQYSVLQITGIQREKANKSRRILVCHNKCGFKYSVNYHHFMHGQGCPRCKKSHGEQRVRRYLEAHNFHFLEQYVIHTTSGRYLRLDFYLEQNNKRYAIEYNGIQHYQPIKWFNGQQGYQEQCIKDEEKLEYCNLNNIQLIIIPFNDEHMINSQELAQRLRGQVTE